MATDCNKYTESARRGAGWIVERQRSDGSFFDVETGIGGYYKIPYAVGVSGFVPEAIQLLRWVKGHNFTSEGDFRAPSRRATRAASAVTAAETIFYFHASLPG